VKSVSLDHAAYRPNPNSGGVPTTASRVTLSFRNSEAGNPEISERYPFRTLDSSFSTFSCLLLEPLKGALHKSLCVLLDAHAVRENQLVEIPGQQLFQLLTSSISVGERKSDVNWNAAIRILNPGNPQQNV